MIHWYLCWISPGLTAWVQISDPLKPRALEPSQARWVRSWRSNWRDQRQRWDRWLNSNLHLASSHLANRTRSSSFFEAVQILAWSRVWTAMAQTNFKFGAHLEPLLIGSRRPLSATSTSSALQCTTDACGGNMFEYICRWISTDSRIWLKTWFLPDC